MDNSTKLFAQAQTIMPGGVNSPVRAFQSVGGKPLFFQSGQGAYLYDEDDKRYIDYVGAFGPAILGHANPTVISALQTAIRSGLGFGAPHRSEVALAAQIIDGFPSIEQIRLVNSGTEATQSAIRLARGITKRNKIVKFEGCYHGHVDSLLIQAGSGALTFGIPNSPGIPESLAQHTVVTPYNDSQSLIKLFKQHGETIAAVIIEPIAGNMNCILPMTDFLPLLRTLCDEYQSLLIFDEVMTGFRVARGGAQAIYQVTPDLTCLGKIIGGGLPVGAFGGKRALMQYLAPTGPVYQAGTFSGNPITMAAGIATLSLLVEADVYNHLHQATTYLTQELKALAIQYGIPLQVQNIGGMFGLLFSEQDPITCYKHVASYNHDHFIQFFHNMLAAGVYFAPSAFEASFISIAHTPAVLDETLSAAKQVFSRFA